MHAYVGAAGWHFYSALVAHLLHTRYEEALTTEEIKRACNCIFSSQTPSLIVRKTVKLKVIVLHTPFIALQGLSDNRLDISLYRGSGASLHNQHDWSSVLGDTRNDDLRSCRETSGLKTLVGHRGCTSAHHGNAGESSALEGCSWQGARRLAVLPPAANAGWDWQQKSHMGQQGCKEPSFPF